MLKRLRSCNKTKFDWTDNNSPSKEKCAICSNPYTAIEDINNKKTITRLCYPCNYILDWRGSSKAWQLMIYEDNRIRARLAYAANNKIKVMYMDDQGYYLNIVPIDTRLKNNTLNLAQIINTATTERSRLMRKEKATKIPPQSVDPVALNA